VSLRQNANMTLSRAVPFIALHKMHFIARQRLGYPIPTHIPRLDLHRYVFHSFSNPFLFRYRFGLLDSLVFSIARFGEGVFQRLPTVQIRDIWSRIPIDADRGKNI
jgi:hypothetical protein